MDLPGTLVDKSGHSNSMTWGQVVAPQTIIEIVLKEDMISIVFNPLLVDHDVDFVIDPKDPIVRGGCWEVEYVFLVWTWGVRWSDSQWDSLDDVGKES